MFTLIKSEPKRVINKYDLYINAFCKTIKEYEAGADDKKTIRKLIFYGVRSINEKSEHTLEDFKMVGIINTLIESLTPGEFINLFPITKNYDGERWGIKDYFYTTDYLKKIGIDKTIGEDPLSFLWEYWNMEINIYVVNLMSILSLFRVQQGEKTLGREWADILGVETYTLHKDNNGKEYTIDSKGRSRGVSDSKSRHLKIVRGS